MKNNSFFILLCVLLGFAPAYAQKVTSVLEILDVSSGQRTVVREFPYLIEAPNWTHDGQWLVYNSGGHLFRLSPDQPGEPEEINTGFAVRCNNDHVLAPDGRQIAISHGTKEDGQSRVYTLPLAGTDAPRSSRRLPRAICMAGAPMGSNSPIARRVKATSMSMLSPQRAARKCGSPLPKVSTMVRSIRPAANTSGSIPSAAG